jgi:hypothetical protein
MTATWPTGCNPFDTKPGTFEWPPSSQCIDHIGGTGWRISAGWWKYGRNEPLVHFHQKDQWKRKYPEDEGHTQMYYFTQPAVCN